jgi:alpha-ribazole phosphatase/probable phosphoglycerate mutase
MLMFLVRHAESTWNRLKRIQGQRDPHLSPYGKKEAKSLARRFRKLTFEAAYTSPLRRAFQTAEIIVGRRIDLTYEDGLREISLGEWEGKTLPQIRKRYGEAFDRWAVRPTRVRVPGGEDFRSFVARVKRTLSLIEKRHPDGNVLVVCHGGVISTFASMVLNLPPDDVWCLTVKNASLTIVEAGSGLQKLVTFNDISHLLSLRDIKPSDITHVD